jgi:hypothetical protein
MSLSFNYSSRYVVFLDIFGFKDKFAKIEKHHALFELLIELPAIVAKTLEMANSTFGTTVDVQGTAFSDTIVFSAAASQPDRPLYCYKRDRDARPTTAASERPGARWSRKGYLSSQGRHRLRPGYDRCLSS